MNRENTKWTPPCFVERGLNSHNPKKADGHNEPLRGRLQLSRRAERDFFRKGGARNQCEMTFSAEHKKPPQAIQSLRRHGAGGRT